MLLLLKNIYGLIIYDPFMKIKDYPHIRHNIFTFVTLTSAPACLYLMLFCSRDHLPIREVGLLLFVPPWCALLSERPWLHCKSSFSNCFYNVTMASIKLSLWPRDQNSTNNKHTWAEGCMTKLKICSDECTDNWLTLV